MPFQKGQSGNPSGRPKRDWSWEKLLDEVAGEIEVKTGKPFRDLVAKRLWIEAVNGNLLAMKELMNRMDGMPKQTTDITSDGERIQSIDASAILNKIYGEQPANSEPTDTTVAGEVHTDGT